MNQDYTVVSSKNNSLLLRSKQNNLCYRIQFKIKRNNNQSINPAQHINFDTYTDLLRLNHDVLDDISIELVENEPQSRKVMMQIKPIGQALGIKGKYIITKINLVCPENNQCVGLVGSSIPLCQTNFQPNPVYEEMICSESKLFAFWDDNDKSLMVQYDFTLIDPTFEKHGLEVPRSVSDISALLIKKLFLRMKEYKETQINK